MAKRPQSPPKTFEEAIGELETILADIEAGEVGLEESLSKYERGAFLVQHCRTVLNNAEKQIELLSKGPDGSLQSETAPLAGDESSSSENEADPPADPRR